ncbi:hypothetical protein ACQ4PT_021107 [Festuca glaucescens]
MADAEPWKTVKIPPIVQELVTSMQEPSSLYVIPEQNRAALAGSEMLDPIPIIDLRRLSDNNTDEVCKLRSALENWGLFLAVGHGVEPGFLGEVMKVTREFFKLPLEEKQKYSNLVNGNEVRIEGYGNDMVPPPFRDVLSEYTVRCRNIANLFLENLAKLLNLREDYFIDMLDENAMTYARLNYYPHCPKPDHVVGMKPHTDASVITIVFIDDNVSGLQLQNNGVWYNVPIVSNALLVNIGDVMEIMSNGFFKSPVHRVVTNAEKERLSLVMFYTMDPEREIEPVPELVDEKRPRRYRNIKTKEYLAQLFETFARGTLAIDTVKI